MEGWTEDEIRNKNLMAPCGLYCGACGVYIATRDGNEKFRSIMGNLYGTIPEETACLGCMQPDPPEKLYGPCQNCELRDCIKSKGFYSCHQCEAWPCELAENFGITTGRRVIQRTIPIWRDKVAKLGDEEGSMNGHGQNVNVTTVRHVANRYSGARNVVGPAKKKSLMNWMVLLNWIEGHWTEQMG